MVLPPTVLLPLSPSGALGDLPRGSLPRCSLPSPNSGASEVVDQLRTQELQLGVISLHPLIDSKAKAFCEIATKLAQI
ncbi:hypothetical protein L6452_05137 [Arctium lappa]|uniref:Uncharacterized protein n=1 Tax=Arctium lappa TaxID=4217 RepID=A0ACB9EFV2_ARCLA|nr:hypothetical protein L6452_05137 [Arctium lappa]